MPEPIKKMVQTSNGPKEGVVVNVNSTSGGPVVCQLDDGTELRLRPVVVEVIRIDGEWDDEGNPIYVARTTQIVSATATPARRKKADS
jgi:hypothetical protein